MTDDDQDWFAGMAVAGFAVSSAILSVLAGEHLMRDDEIAELIDRVLLNVEERVGSLAPTDRASVFARAHLKRLLALWRPEAPERISPL